MTQIIRIPNAWEGFGTGLGSGLGSGIETLLNQKMQNIQSEKEAKGLEILGYNPQDAQALAQSGYGNLAAKLKLSSKAPAATSTNFEAAGLPGAWAGLDPRIAASLASRQEEYAGGPGIARALGGSPAAPAAIPTSTQNLSAANTRQMPAAAAAGAQALQKTIQEMPAQQAPTQQTQPQGQQAPAQAMPAPQEQEKPYKVPGPSFKDRENDLEQQRQAIIGQLANKELKTNIGIKAIDTIDNKLENLRKEKRERIKDKKGFLTEESKAQKGATARLNNYLQQRELVDSGELTKPNIVNIAKLFGFDEDAVASWSGNPATQLYTKIGRSNVKGIKDFFGSRPTVIDVQLYMQTLPELSKTDEGKKVIIENGIITESATLARNKIVQRVIEDNDGIPPENIEQIVDKICIEKLDPGVTEAYLANTRHAIELAKIKKKTKGASLSLRSA